MEPRPKINLASCDLLVYVIYTCENHLMLIYMCVQSLELTSGQSNFTKKPHRCSTRTVVAIFYKGRPPLQKLPLPRSVQSFLQGSRL